MTLQDNKYTVQSNITEPTVITKDFLIKLVIRQGPKDQIAEFIQEDDIKLEEVKEIRIEHCNILQICHLWIMKNLVKLSFCNNKIEKIENLDELVNLKELDLSFNNIEVVENLNHLVNLEILSLFSNKITQLAGLDNLQKLQIFSIGKNLLNDWNHVLYLRKCKALRSLNTDGNPCAEQDGYFNYVVALIPQLIYFRYKMICQKDKNFAIEKHHREIVSLEDAESAEKEKLEGKKALEDYIHSLTNAYVECLNEDYLFEKMFKNDTAGRKFLDINTDIMEEHYKYREIFCEICAELLNFGLSENEKRSKELQLFTGVVGKEKIKVEHEARKLTDNLFDKKLKFVADITGVLTNLFEEEDILKEKFVEVQSISKAYADLVERVWSELMGKEVVLHQQILDTTEIFKVNLTDMVNTFVEFAREHFAQMRNAEVKYNSNLNNLVTKFKNSFGNDKMPKNLNDICGDKDILKDNLSATHDIHLKVIDDREDTLITRINAWLNNLIENLIEEETKRYKRRVHEILQFLDFQNEEFKRLRQEHLYSIDDPFVKLGLLFNDDT